MDLRQHGLAGHADRLLQSYLEHSALAEDCRPLPLFLSLRAATRCFTLACSAERLPEAQTRTAKAGQAQALLEQAKAYLRGDGQPLTPR
jgi:aminoglycoside phosphotransferase family enzyme